MPCSSHLLLALTVLTLAASCCLASAGDRDQGYKDCVSLCEPQWRDCPRSRGWLGMSLRWTCRDECRYECMHRAEAQRASRHERAVQYHGKWPFRRVWHMQEVVSVAASVANGAAVLVGIAQLMRQRAQALAAPGGVVPSFNTMFALSMAHCAIALLAWTCSALFHARDLVWTEAADYLSAALLVAYSCGHAVALIVVGVENPLWMGAAFVPTVGNVVYRFYRYAFTGLDYGSNMSASVVMVLVGLVLWVYWSARHWSVRPHSYKIVLFFSLVLAAASLELGDFPPLWGLVDAHSLWHVGTVFPMYLWCTFLRDELRWTAPALRPKGTKAV